MVIEDGLFYRQVKVSQN